MATLRECSGTGEGGKRNSRPVSSRRRDRTKAVDPSVTKWYRMLSREGLTVQVRKMQKNTSVKRNRKPLRDGAPGGETPPCSLGSLGDFLYPGVWGPAGPPSWPPDMFALAATILQKSGAYTTVIRAWPPPDLANPTAQRFTRSEWNSFIKQVGLRWRLAAVANEPVPPEVRRWWECVVQHREDEVSAISSYDDLCQALLQLCAAADEASEGVGIPSADASEGNPFEVEANLLLVVREGGSLCRHIHPSRARVLPKLHTPRNGLTIRSLSHNLALCPAGEINPRWYRLPKYQGHCLNLLVFPWPNNVVPAQFKATVPRTGALLNMPDKRGFFAYMPRRAAKPLSAKVMDLVQQATEQVGHIDGVIMPELAVTSSQHRTVSSAVLNQNAFLICGVTNSSLREGDPGSNYLAFDVPIQERRVSLIQHKHHRWKLDGAQIRQYGLGTELDPRTEWWEHVAIEPRSLAFVSMRPWLTVSALICEDLARQDPAAELVRAVGPNLVIALLMDAPQLASRWPARYATVLADDPGSSVLTVTSLGMAGLSRPLHVTSRSRVVALWKDAYSGVPVEIDLPVGKSAAVLNITVQDLEEFTADGRSDDGATGYPVLSGVHFI